MSDKQKAQEYNADLAERQVEINEWSYNNKMDTLFVFQVLFVSLLFLSILFYLKGAGVIGGAFVWYVFVVLVILVAVLIINRAVYTQSRRDPRFWNRRRFAEDSDKQSPLPRGDASLMDYIDAVRNKFGLSGRCGECPPR